jgi:hypothetical protein
MPLFRKTLFTLLLSIPALATAQNESCMECHNDPDLIIENEAGQEVSLYVDSTKYASSIHAEFACVDCHTDIEEVPHEEDLAKVNCGLCHEDAVVSFQKSTHSKSKEDCPDFSSTCSSCHGKHDILPSSNPGAMSHPVNIAKTCTACHANEEMVEQCGLQRTHSAVEYSQSVHGLAIMSENFDAAVCTSCHGHHEIRPMNDREAPIYWTNVPETCGQCHGEVYEQYTESSHWTAAVRGNKNAPVCTDCHGEHQIRASEDPASPVNPLRVSAVTCERCHASELLAERYGVASERVATYKDSYHGLAVKGGSVQAANCASCHGIHKILPSSNPESAVHPTNLNKTCGTCHRKAVFAFTSGPVHVTSSTTPGRVVAIVKEVYVWMIVVVIGFMIFHNGIDFVRRNKRRLTEERNEWHN